MADAMDRLVEQLSEKLQEKLMERVMQRAQEKLAASMGSPSVERTAPTASTPRRGRKADKTKTDDKAMKSCPKCGESKPVGTGFGFKPVHLVGGTVMKPQSYCRKCRAQNPQQRK